MNRKSSYGAGLNAHERPETMLLGVDSRNVELAVFII